MIMDSDEPSNSRTLPVTIVRRAFRDVGYGHGPIPEEVAYEFREHCNDAAPDPQDPVNADLYDQSFNNGYVANALYNVVSETAGNYVDVLDVGTGTGVLAVPFLLAGKNVHGVDIDVANVPDSMRALGLSVEQVRIGEHTVLQPSDVGIVCPPFGPHKDRRACRNLTKAAIRATRKTYAVIPLEMLDELATMAQEMDRNCLPMQEIDFFLPERSRTFHDISLFRKMMIVYFGTPGVPITNPDETEDGLIVTFGPKKSMIVHVGLGLTMIDAAQPDQPPDLSLTPAEKSALDKMADFVLADCNLTDDQTVPTDPPKPPVATVRRIPPSKYSRPLKRKRELLLGHRARCLSRKKSGSQIKKERHPLAPPTPPLATSSPGLAAAAGKTPSFLRPWGSPVQRD